MTEAEISARPKASIERMLSEYGCTSYVYGRQGRDGWVIFEVGGRRVMFRLKLPDPADDKFTRTPGRGQARSPRLAAEAYEAAVRHTWYALADGIRAKLKAVESGIGTFTNEFLAYIVLPGQEGQTVGEWMEYQLAEEFRKGDMLALMPGSPD